MFGNETACGNCFKLAETLDGFPLLFSEIFESCLVGGFDKNFLGFKDVELGCRGKGGSFFLTGYGVEADDFCDDDDETIGLGFGGNFFDIVGEDALLFDFLTMPVVLASSSEITERDDDFVLFRSIGGFSFIDEEIVFAVLEGEPPIFGSLSDESERALFGTKSKLVLDPLAVEGCVFDILDIAFFPNLGTGSAGNCERASATLSSSSEIPVDSIVGFGNVLLLRIEALLEGRGPCLVCAPVSAPIIGKSSRDPVGEALVVV